MIEQKNHFSHFHFWRLSVAPMMDWTDKHCRFFHRLLSRHTLLYTEMITAAAIVHGNNLDRFLAYNEREHPVALQLGGSDPDLLSKAIEMAEPYRYDEINLNVGCPSDRVKSGSFGACLMLTPNIVADCITAMKATTNLPITIKCRLGVDDQDVEATLPYFLETIVNAGVDGVIIHARKAILGGLSPHQNRTIPPLDYALVHEMKDKFPNIPISINGGITSLSSFETHYPKLDGIMIGREAYHNPWILSVADTKIFNRESDPIATPHSLLLPLCEYAEEQRKLGVHLNHITRHLLGLFSGQSGARAFRRILTEESYVPGAGPEVIEKAWRAIHSSD